MMSGDNLIHNLYTVMRNKLSRSAGLATTENARSCTNEVGYCMYIGRYDTRRRVGKEEVSLFQWIEDDLAIAALSAVLSADR